MKNAKIILIILSVVALILGVGVLILSGILPYYLLGFSNTCAQECAKSGYASSQCVVFPSLYPANENQCGNDGVDLGMTSDCRNKPRLGGSKQCCCNG